MILYRHFAGPLVGLLATLIAAPAFAAGQTASLEPVTPAASARTPGSQVGKFPTIEATEARPFEEAAAITTAPVHPEALFVPPGHLAVTITSIATGNWNALTTWSTGAVPTAADDVVIADGTTVTINTPAACGSLAVGQGVSGTLVYEVTNPQTLTVTNNATIAAGGTLQSAATGTQAAHVLSIGGSLTNNGTLDLSTSANTAAALLAFTGPANATFGGTGGTTDIRTIQINKGTSASSVLELNPTNFTVRGAAVNLTFTNGMLLLTNGTLKIGGTFSGQNALGPTASWTIPATCGLWLANPNYTIPAQNGTISLDGTLIMDAGTFNVGSSAGNRLGHALGSVVRINGGAINISGRFSPNSNGVNYTQTGGTLTVTTVDNTSTTAAGFDVLGSSSFTMSGGSIVLQKASTAASGPRDYRNTSATVNISGGTLQLGNASSPGAQNYRLAGVAPAVSVTTLGGNHVGTLLGAFDARGATTIAPNAKLTLNGQVFFESGASITNDGTIDGSTAGSRLYWFGSTPQTYGGSGVTGTLALPLATMDVDNLSTVTLSPVSPAIILTRVNMFTGGVINANKLQLGVGGASVAVTQIGVASNITTAGSYDVAPTFAYGTGGYNILYAPETAARTTGFEVPASRALNVLSVGNEHDVALAGGDLSATTVSFPVNSKNLTTGSNALSVNAGGTLTRVNATTSGWVVGNLKKDAPAGNSTRAFEVGGATSYAPVSVDLVGVAALGSLTGRSDSGDLVVPAGSGIDGSKSVNRNWTLSGSPGLALTSATGTFNFPAAEVDGGANTANFIVRKLDGSTWSSTTAGTRTATSTQATWSSGFSSFAIGEVASYAVNVTVVGSGSVAKFPDQATYTFGSSVDLTPTAAAGWHFVGWSGDASGNANPLTVNVDAAKNITATFAINQYAVNVTVVGSGSVAKDPDQALYDHGSSVELTATPAPGSHFVGWTGDVISAANPVNVTVDAAKAITATFALNQYAVNVTVVGSGSVAKDPDQALYDEGSSVDLTATPALGWHFVGWSGDVVSASNPVNVTVNAAKNITATFAIDQYAVDVTVVGNGSVAKDPDQPLYDYGSSVDLTPTPAAGWHFVGWSGNASGNANPLTVLVDAAKNITATFEINQYALNVAIVGNGTVAKDPDQPLYDHGTGVDLTATAAPGYHFVGWTGDITSAANPLNVSMIEDLDLTATFAINQYAVNVSVIGSGSVAKDPDQALYAEGSSVDLTATPAVGWHFVGWSGDVVSASNPVNVTVNAAKNITATFAIDQYAVNVTVVGNGSVTKDPDQPLYDYGSSVDLTPTPAAGWHFVGWSGNASGNANPLTVLVDAAKNITATFAINQYALNVAIVGNGTVVKDPDQPLYDHGTAVEITATPAPGYHFVGWTGDITSAANPLNVSMIDDLDLTATFAINQYAVNVNVIGSGSVAKDPDQALYDEGSSVDLTATPAVGWHFVGWSGDASGNANPLSVLVNGAKNITATFALNQYAVNVSVVGNGSVTKDPDQPLYDYGSSVDLTATPAAGWHFTGWSGDASGSTNPLSVLVNGAKNITATFALNQYAVNVSVVGNGSVAKDPDQLLYDYGSNVDLTATPAAGWHFVGWSGDASGNTNPLSVLVNGAKNITATFAINQYAVNVSVVGSGAVAKDPDQASYDYGSSVELTATPAAGWHFVGWSGDASGNANPLSVLVEGVKNITATFEINTYTLTINIVGNGSVATDPVQASYDHGSSVLLTATANPGWTFDGWSGDVGGNTNPRNVLMNSNKTITATFIDASLPTAHLLAPNTSGEVLVVGVSHAITWTATDNEGVTSIDLLLSRTGPAGPYEVIASSIPNTGSYDWIVTGPPTTNGVIAVIATDAGSNTGSDTSDELLEIVVASVGVDTPVLKFALLPVVPSPSVTFARLRYELPKDAQVDLSIIDVRGREVAKLVHGVQPAGRHAATWDGQTPSGRAPAGVYFARCLSSGARVMQRIVLLR